MSIVNFTLLTTYTVIYCFILKTLQASSDSCHISRSTVRIVEDCPNSEEQWQEAAIRKNCEAHARQCSEPDKLEYHCVINPFINETLEVCAYAQNIVLGYCTEYNIGENMIRQSANTYCQQFKKNPCPIFYRSTEAYKYQDCYYLTKKAALVTVDRESTIKVPTVNNPASSLSTKPDFSGNEGRIFIILLVLLVTSTVILIGLQIFNIYCRMRERNRRLTANKGNRNVSINLVEES